MNICKIQFTILLAAFVGAAFGANQSEGEWVKVINRQDSSAAYSYSIPGYSTTNANGSANCYGSSYSANCMASARSTTTTSQPRSGLYTVSGATYTLLLPDRRAVVVNCDSKYAMKGDHVNRRSCRTPFVDQVFVVFNGDKAKLEWPVSLDGRKMQSETYKVVAILNKQAQ